MQNVFQSSFVGLNVVVVRHLLIFILLRFFMSSTCLGVGCVLSLVVETQVISVVLEKEFVLFL